jgi:hypothetical protein
MAIQLPLGRQTRLLGVDTGRVYFEGIGAGANSTTHSTWFVLPGESTAIRLISNEAGWAFYRGGDVPFNSIGMRVRFEPVAASTNTGAVPTPTLRDQHTAHRQEYLRVSAINDVQLMQIMGATAAAGAALAAGMFAAPVIAANPGSSTVALDVAGGFVPGMEAAGAVSAAGPLALAAHRTGAFEDIGEVASLIGGKAVEGLGGIRTAEGILYNGLTGPGPLADVASTFRSSTYTQKVLDSDLVLYRVYGGKAGKLGPYWSRVEPAGPLQARIDTALLPEWGNAATKTSAVRVPVGTTIFEGAVAPQSNSRLFLPGGGNQVYIPRVDPKWLISK